MLVMSRGITLRSQNPKKSTKDKKQTTDMPKPPASHEARLGSDKESERESPGQLLKQMTTMTNDLKDFKKDIQSAISDLKGDLKADLKEELAAFRQDLDTKLTELGSSIQTQGQAITELQERVAGLEEVNAVSKDSLLFLLKERRRLQEKVTDLESRSRRCNIRIYGIPEGTEGDNMPKFLEQFLTNELTLPADTALQIQRAHRAAIQKPAPGLPPRSIVVCFQQFSVKDMVLSLAWKKKISIANNSISFDHDYASEVVEKRRSYGGVKKALKEKGIRFQTPFTKIRIHWDTGTETYKDVQEATAELRARGMEVARPKEDAGSRLEGDVRNVFHWQRVTSGETGDVESRVREKLQAFRRRSQ